MRALFILLALSACRVSDVRPEPAPPPPDDNLPTDLSGLCKAACERRDVLKCEPLPNCPSNCELFSKSPIYSWHPECMVVAGSCEAWDGCPEGR